MSRYAHIVRELTPPAVWHYSKRRLPGLVRALGGHYTHIRFDGDYATYAQARAAATGYDAPAILARTREALLKVRNGEVRWERDAMVSDSLDMHWPLLACLTRSVAMRGDRKLRVLDFGGSLGSTYFWCRPFLGRELDIHWHVVEQPNHVKVGRSDFENDELHFHFTIDDVLKGEKPDVLLVSGVIHFLEDPEAGLRQMLAHRIPEFILDRTPLWDHDRHRLTVQHVPREIYEASYPAWFLSRERVLGIIEESYDLEFKAPDSETWEIDGEPVPNALWYFRAKAQRP